MAPEHPHKLLDEIRELDAKAAGKRVELCLGLGQRAQAEMRLRDMNALTQARIAARTAGCYFMEQGDSARAAAGRATS